MGQLHDLSYKQYENGDQEIFVILLLMLNIRNRRSRKPIVIISRDGPSTITGERELSVMASGDDDFQFGQEASREHYYFRGGDSRNKLFCDGSQTNQNQL